MKKLRYFSLLLAFLLCFTGCSSSVTLSTNTEPEVMQTTDKKLSGLTVHYIDVGQGDSQLLQSDGVNILIDTGESDQSDRLISYLEKQGVETIDHLFLTHPHTDHMGGAVDILNHFPVKEVYLTSRTHTTSSYRKLIETIKKQNITRTQAKKGVKISFTKNLSGEILAPEKEYEDLNASSIVMKVTYGNTRFIFNGDATIETEQDILASGADVSADVYKVAHHGSSSSNSEEFLQAVNPSICIIQLAADNSYGHPHREVKKLLSDMGMPVYRTDEEGDIIVTSDGKKLSVTTKNGSQNVANTGNNSSEKTEKTTYIGNKNSKVFHKTTCSALPAKKNQMTFESKKAAQKAGYTPCSRCNP